MTSEFKSHIHTLLTRSSCPNRPTFTCFWFCHNPAYNDTWVKKILGKKKTGELKGPNDNSCVVSSGIDFTHIHSIGGPHDGAHRLLQLIRTLFAACHHREFVRQEVTLLPQSIVRLDHHVISNHLIIILIIFCNPFDGGPVR